MPHDAPDCLSTSVAVKSQSGEKAPGSAAASVIALMVSFCDVKYAWSEIASVIDAVGTAVPFGSVTAARASKVKSATASEVVVGTSEEKECRRMRSRGARVAKASAANPEL